MKSREEFINARKQRRDKLGLKMRLVIFVAIELVICILLGFGFDYLLKKIFNFNVQVPLMLELIGVSIIISILITGVLSFSFFAPIKNLREAMYKVADGDFSVRLKNKTGSKEIKEVYTGFNLMVSELESTEILQTDFVSSVSHEFKTPINAIEGYAMLLQDGENLSAEQKEYVEKIIYNTSRISSLTSSILLLSKIENRSIPINQINYSLDEQIRQSILALESSWVKKDIEFDVEMEDTIYFGNESLMHHVWDNLIGNAIKFSPEGGTIRIRLIKETTKIIFTIEDNGPGISEAAIKRIFDKFYQGDTSHKAEGNGLGLALVKRILSLENGTVSVENIKEGGCRFTVTLIREPAET
ncbi:MAG: HAMP domain-containing sensor histidine kinase [Eubacteriales bacterium]|nr:HAMP domain-containing sensor histidine kinase [Eubacteriales bacterium]